MNGYSPTSTHRKSYHGIPGTASRLLDGAGADTRPAGCTFSTCTRKPNDQPSRAAPGTENDMSNDVDGAGPAEALVSHGTRKTCIGAGSRAWCGNCLHYLENAPEDGTEPGGMLEPFRCQVPNAEGRRWSQFTPLAFSG